MLILGGEKTANIFKPYNLIIIFISLCLLCLMNFTMDKSLEHAWDEMVKKFFLKKEIEFEIA